MTVAMVTIKLTDTQLQAAHILFGHIPDPKPLMAEMEMTLFMAQRAPTLFRREMGTTLFMAHWVMTLLKAFWETILCMGVRETTLFQVGVITIS